MMTPSGAVFRSFTLFALVALVALAACSDDPAEPEGPGTVVLQFDHTAGSTDFELNTGTYTNAAGNDYTTSNLEYVVAGFELEGSAGTYESSDPHYRKAGNAGTRTLTFTDVPSGTYSTLRFHHGIEGSMNQAGAFPSLDASGMAWPEAMGGGYHYMRHEGAYTASDGGTANFTTHTGPTMGNDFSIPVQLNLPSGVEVEAGETTTIQLQMDVNEWYTGSAVYDFNDYGMIMGNQTVQAMLQGNGSDVWSVGAVN